MSWRLGGNGKRFENKSVNFITKKLTISRNRLRILIAMEKRFLRRQMVGTVVSDKMDKTVIVLVERLVKHKLYQKYVKRRSKFAAHDENNGSRVGDKVLIVQSRPLSKIKRWRVSKIVEKAV